MDTRMVRRQALMMTMGLGMTACFGSFALTNKLHKWNNSLDSKWLKWFLFLGLIILPVYSICILADAIVFNTIEFWTDKNPIQARTVKTDDGDELTFTRDPEIATRVKMERFHEGKLVATYYVRNLGGDAFQLEDSNGKVITAIRPVGDEVEIYVAEKQQTVRVPKSQLKHAEVHLRSGASLEDALGNSLESAENRALLVRKA